MKKRPAFKKAARPEEIKPLIELCKAGKLFDVQAWIAAGNPVNLPPPPEKGHRPRSPLQYAIAAGFHSMVQVLLEGGAEIEDSDRYSALSHALRERQYDIAKLLVAYGADAQAVDMYDVFDTWQPDIMEYFIERGADVETGNPLAQAFCDRIRTALRIYKKYKDRFPSFQEQANIALRYHCRKGNLKWISLMLWAGADPYAKGAESPEEESDPEDGSSALETAALWGHFEVFNLRQIHLDPNHEHAGDLMQRICYGEGAALLEKLLQLGFPANNQPNGGSSHIEHLLTSMSWWPFGDRKNIDTEKSREKMKMLHLLVQHGARWKPADPSSIRQIRRSLLLMTADYTAELIWIMAKYRACDRAVIESLLKSPAIQAHLACKWDRIRQLVVQLPQPATVPAERLAHTAPSPG